MGDRTRARDEPVGRDDGSSPPVADASSTSSTSGPRELAALVLLAVVPWSVQAYAGGDVSLVFPWGLASLDPAQTVDLYSYLFRYTQGLPDYIYAWPLGVVLYLGAVASALAGLVTGREDPRVTGGLLAVAGVTQLTLAAGFAQPGRTAVPTGTLALWAVAWWCYWPAVRRRSERPEST